MLAQERHSQILTLLEERGTVRTIDLANEFQVTDETIRRDLQILAETHQISRVHGGATSSSGRPKLQSFIERRAMNVDRKMAIGRAALKHILPGQTYAFDSSTTVYELVSLMPNEACRVITNAHPVIHELIGHSELELISTGGRYQPKTQTFVGIESHSALRRHNINKAFVSCVGLDLQKGVSEGFEDQAIFKEVLAESSEEVIVLSDSSKLGMVSEYFFVGMQQISRVITDDGADPEFLDQIRNLGVEVEVVEI